MRTQSRHIKRFRKHLAINTLRSITFKLLVIVLVKQYFDFYNSLKFWKFLIHLTHQFVHYLDAVQVY